MANRPIYAAFERLWQHILNIVKLSTADWAQTDEAALDFIKNKPVEMTPDDAMDMLYEVGALEFITDENGAVLTDENGAILVI